MPNTYPIQKILLLFFLFFSLKSFSQSDPGFDTLKQKLNRADDSVKLKTLTSIAYRYEEYNNDSAQIYMDKAIALAKKINRKDRQLSLTVSKAEIFNLTSSFDSSRKYLQIVASQVSDTAYPKVKGYMLMTYADVFNQQGDYDSAISKLYTALHIYETLNDSLRMAQVYGSLGRNYSALRDFTKSKEVYLHSLHIAEALHNVRMLSEINIYLGTEFLGTSHNDSALYYLSKAEKLSLDNPDMESRLVTIYGNLGDIQSGLGNSAKAISYFSKAVAEAKKFNILSLVPIQQASIAKEYIKTKNYIQAKEFLIQAEAGLIPDDDVQTDQFVYKTFSEYHFLTGNFEEGEKYFNKYSTLLDSSLNTSKTQAIAETEVKYETAKKDKELLKQKLDIAEKDRNLIKQRTAMYVLLVFFVFAILATILLYNRYRLKQQAKLDAAIIKEQQLGIKAVIEAQDMERDRLSKELHDSVLQQLVAAKAGISLLENKTDFNDAQKKEQLQQVSNTMDEAANDLRSISHLMMPRALTEEGLPAALEKLSAGVFNQAGIKYSFDNNGFSKRFSPQKELQLYRIVQEIFSNILKHAQANEVNINLSEKDGNVLLYIKDNGIGFNEAEAKEKGGAGLFNIYSRIRNINAIVFTEPVQPTGSCFVIECPV